MKIQFNKKHQKPSLLIIIRSDGTQTWTRIPPGLELHDLGHFVVESELGFDQAFFGLIDQGYEAIDFELPADQKPQALKKGYIPAQAVQTEHIVNLLQTEFMGSEKNEDFIPMLTEILEDDKLPFPTLLTPKSLERIRKRYTKLTNEWRFLEPGKTLYLDLMIR